MADEELSYTPPPGTETTLPGEDPKAFVGVRADYRSPTGTSVVERRRRRGVAGDRGTRAPVVDATVTYGPDTEVAPRYRNEDVNFEVDGWAPERVAGLQRALAGIGYLNGTFTYGAWNPATRAAFKDLLAYSNRTGNTWTGALTELQAGAAEFPEEEEGTKRAPLVIEKTDPMDLRRVFRAAATSLRGRIDNDQVDRMIQAYQQQEITAQQQAYGMSGAAGGGYDTAPSPEAFVEDTLRREEPGLTGAVDISNTFNDFLDIIGGAGGGG